MITPSTSDQIEYVPFNISFTVSADPLNPLAPPPIIQSVSVTASDGKDYSKDLTITISSPTTFTLSGTLSDIFNRQIVYLDKNDVSGNVSRFKDLPLGFNTLYHYQGATVNSITLTVNVTTDVGGESATINIQNNYNVANANLINYVKQGKF